jgi:hypothetical protein
MYRIKPHKAKFFLSENLSSTAAKLKEFSSYPHNTMGVRETNFKDSLFVTNRFNGRHNGPEIHASRHKITFCNPDCRKG